MYLKNIALFSVVIFSLLSMFLLVQHELHATKHESHSKFQNFFAIRRYNITRGFSGMKTFFDPDEEATETPVYEEGDRMDGDDDILNKTITMKASNPSTQPNTTLINEYKLEVEESKESIERKGILICNGTSIDSEVIYWKIVPGDEEFESPITPHHDLHHDKYITFEYDHGGWNNIRMGLECLIVLAHAVGRTIVLPPPQHLYLLNQAHHDDHKKKPRDEMGFEDFYDTQLLKSHKGSHIITMEEFLAKEAITGGLHGVYPEKNSSNLWGRHLWSYLASVADVKPVWFSTYIALPDNPNNFAMTNLDKRTLERLQEFGSGRHMVVYDKTLQDAHHIHIPGDDQYRLLTHHYAFLFFQDVSMQSFYRRYIRDYMRYKDSIQCAGHELLQLVREDAKRVSPQDDGAFYALHIRRGDFQFKEVKLSADEIVANLRYSNGSAIIPPGSFVYISTDDPDGKCAGCLVQRIPCEKYELPKPTGCQVDTSWNAFIKAGWKIRFLKDYMKQGHLRHVNPNALGMIEAIVCSRAKIFAGTWFSSFSGYIVRLRGYHGLAEDSFFHSHGKLMAMRDPKSNGNGFAREYRRGWTDDGGNLI